MSAFAPTTPLYARHSYAAQQPPQSQSQHPATTTNSTGGSGGWGGFPSAHDAAARDLSRSHQLIPQQQQPQQRNSYPGLAPPTTPGALTRPGSGHFGAALQAQHHSNPAGTSTFLPDSRALAPRTGTAVAAAGASAPVLSVPSSKAVTVAKPASAAPAAASSSATTGAMATFSPADLSSRVIWNAVFLAGFCILPYFGPVQGVIFLARGFVSVLSGGALDSIVDSLGHNSVLLAKIVFLINVIDALVRAQSLAYKEEAAAASTGTGASPIKPTQASKLALGVRSSPQTRPSPGAALHSPAVGATAAASPRTNTTNPLRTPLFLQPNLRASLDEASLLATPPRLHTAEGGPGPDLGSSLGAGSAFGGADSSLRGSLGHGHPAVGRRWPSGSPASVLQQQQKQDGKRNVSPVSLFHARRAVSGRGRSTSGLQFDSSFDAGDDDASTESHSVEYGLKVLNSSFSADTSFPGPGSTAPMSTSVRR